MKELNTANFIAIEDVENDSLYTTINNGAIVNIHSKNDFETDSIFHYLKQKETNFKVYKTEDTPGFESKPKNKDWGAIQIIPDFGYYFSSRRGIESVKKKAIQTVGVHGYDSKYKDMHGIFYANGPAFKNGYSTPSVKNIHVYPIICEILGLEIPNDIDGKLEQLKGVLKNKD
jgi:hypothetical protein